MEKIKKISINAIDKVMQNTYTPSKTIEWNGLDITVKHNLTFIDMLKFVDSVVKTCFTTEKSDYLPEVKDFAINKNILERYTNVTLPSNLKHCYDIIYCTDIVDTVISHINPRQFYEIKTAIDDKISNLTQSNINAVNKQISDLYNTLNNLEIQMSQIFDGIDNDAMSGFVKALANGNISEQKLVEEYIKQTKKEE